MILHHQIPNPSHSISYNHKLSLFAMPILSSFPPVYMNHLFELSEKPSPHSN